MADAPTTSLKTQTSPSESSDMDRQRLEEGTPAATPSAGHTVASHNPLGDQAPEGAAVGSAEQAGAGVRPDSTLAHQDGPDIAPCPEVHSKGHDKNSDTGEGGPAEGLLIDLSNGHNDNAQVGEKADPNTGYHGNSQLVCPPEPNISHHGECHVEGRNDPNTTHSADKPSQEGLPDQCLGHFDEMQGPSRPVTHYHGENHLEGLSSLDTDYHGDSHEERPSCPSSGGPTHPEEEMVSEGAREAAPAAPLHPGSVELGPADPAGSQAEASPTGAEGVMSPAATSGPPAAGSTGVWEGAVTAGLNVSSTGGAGWPDNSELGGAAGSAAPPQASQPPTEPVNQSRQVQEGAQEPASGVPAATHSRQVEAAPAQSSGAPETTHSQQEEGAAPAAQQAEHRPTPACEAPVAKPGLGDLFASQETTAPTNVQEVQGTSAAQDLYCISAAGAPDFSATSPADDTACHSAPEDTTNSKVEDNTSQSNIEDTTTHTTVEDVQAHATEDTASTSQEAAAPSIAPIHSRAKSLMEVDQEDNMSDSGVSADFSPGSTQEMDVEPSNETPIEREIRRHAEREETLRKERGLAPAPDHQQYVEVKMKPILNRDTVDSVPPKEKARQRAGAQMQRDIRIESQREEDLVQLGKVMGTYDRGLVQELREKKMIFEQNSPDTSAKDLATLKKMNQSSYSAGETIHQSSIGEAELLSRQVTSPKAIIQPRGNGEKKGPSYAEANGSNVIIVDYNVLLHPVAIGRGQPSQAQGSSLASGPSNASQGSSNGLPLSRSSISSKSTNSFQFGSTNISSNGLQSGNASVSQNSVNGLKVGPSSTSSGGQLSPLLPTTGEPVQENPFFQLRSKSPQSLLEQEIREVRERENELRKLRRSLYGGRQAKDATGGEGSAEPTSTTQEPAVEQEASSGQQERLYSGKLEVTWPPRSCGLQDGQEPGQEDRSQSFPRQKSALVQRWESGMLSGQQPLNDEQ